MAGERVPGGFTARVAAIHAMTWPDRRILVCAAGLIPAIALAVRVAGFRRTHAALEARISNTAAGVDEPDAAAIAQVRQIARLVHVASRHAPVVTTCLHRALVLWWLLRRRGRPAMLRVGARKRDGRFEAHAWVEYGGQVVSDEPGVGPPYVPLAWHAFEYDA